MDVKTGRRANEKNLPHENGKVAPGPGRQKGQINMYSKIIRDAVLLAGNQADKEGLVGYLTKQAKAHPAAFMQLLGKAMPLQVQGNDRGGRVIVEIVKQAGRNLPEPPKMIEGEVVPDEPRDD